MVNETLKEYEVTLHVNLEEKTTIQASSLNDAEEKAYEQWLQRHDVPKETVADYFIILERCKSEKV